MYSKEISQDFLWYSYFGITASDAEESREKAAYRCANRAYRDACRKLSFAVSTSKLDGMRKEAAAKKKSGDIEGSKKIADEVKTHTELKQRFRKDTNEYIVSALLNLKGEYDDVHRTICMTVINRAKAYQGLFDDPLTFGIAQKWVNMTVKNMLVMGLWNDELSRYSGKLHIPIDSYLITAVRRELGIHANSEEYFNKSPWSGIAVDQADQYYAYQRAIREKLRKIDSKRTPLEWEHEMWIREAKEHENT